MFRVFQWITSRTLRFHPNREMDMTESKSQFDLRAMFVLTTLVGVLAATYSWLLSSTGQDIFSDIPPLFMPSTDMLMVGILIIPFFCLPIVLAMAVLAVRSKRRPFTILLFFGLQFVVFVVDVSFSGNAMRFIFAMLLSALGVIVEVVCRRLGRSQIYLGLASLFVTFAWYIAIVCICVSASV